MSASRNGAGRPVGLLVVSAVEALEAVGLTALAVAAVIAGAGSRYLSTTYGVAGTLLVAAVLLAVVAVGSFRARPWSRTSGLVWQVVQLLVGFYALQGDGAQPLIALVAVAPAVLVIVLLFTRPVQEAMARSTGAS